jgi:uncharacterized protein YprB with RNaseH-like and TPR domain
MLKNTFCHIPGIGPRKEQRLWSAGLQSWESCLGSGSIPLGHDRRQFFIECLEESRVHLENNNPHYFSNLLPSHLLWRLFPDFRHTIAYLDIETTGLTSWDNSITTIALYDGDSIYQYIQGENLEDFETDIENYKVIVTYNGRCFDVPFIQWYFRTTLHHAHIDLRYVLKSLGYSGGLKGCERQMGIERGDLDGVDGFFAVLLWEEFRQTRNQKALETLLAYNIQDVVNLETLMIMAYNLKLKDTPFGESHHLRLPSLPEIPFRADVETIEKIKTRIYYHRSYV